MDKLENYKPKGRGFDSRRCHWNFSLAYSFRPHYGPGVGSASTRNEYQQYFPRGKRGRSVGLTTLPRSCADCLEIWEPQIFGTLRACTGIALPLPLPYKLDIRVSFILCKLFVRLFASRIQNNLIGILNIVPNFYLASSSVLFAYELYFVTDLEKITSSIWVISCAILV